MHQLSDEQRITHIRDILSGDYSGGNDHAMTHISEDDVRFLLSQVDQFRRLHRSYLDRYTDLVGVRNEIREVAENALNSQSQDASFAEQAIAIIDR